MNKFFSSKHFFKILTVSTIAGFYFFSTPSFASEQNQSNIDEIKKQMSNDTVFLDAIMDKIVQSPNFLQKIGKIEENQIRSIIKNYLLENPEIMIEVQEALEKKQSIEMALQQKNIIAEDAKLIFNSPNDAVFGNPKGTEAIVEFYDYNCGYCKRSFPDMIALLDTNPNIRFIMKDFPVLGEDSFKAHIVARAFQKMHPEKYLEFHKKLLLSDGRATEGKAVKIAISLGANETKLHTLMKDEKLQEPIQQNARIAYQLGINGTPSYIIGDNVLMGAVGKDVLIQTLKGTKK